MSGNSKIYSNTLKILSNFLADKEAREMFITGSAGTGKTTSLAAVVTYLESKKVDFVVCAYTHKACNVLREKLQLMDKVQTLHSYLNKRPYVNDNAKRLQHIETNIKIKESTKPTLVIIDEFSFVGEKDYVDLLAMYYPEDEFNLKAPTIKVLFVGDLYQLPPVRDQQTIVPQEPYWIQLVKVYRTDNIDLLEAMQKLVYYIQNPNKFEPIESSKNLLRGKNLIKNYFKSKKQNKMILAWTNEKVQYYNTQVQKRELPIKGDYMLGPRQNRFKFIGEVDRDKVTSISAYGLEPLLLNSRFKTLETLLGLSYINFYAVKNNKNEDEIRAVLFGTSNYNIKKKELMKTAITLNNRIQKISNDSAANWCKTHHDSELCIKRKLAWKELLSFKDNVTCFDFEHSLTIHKSQGSTYTEVYLDTKDLNKLRDIKMKLRLMYVAMSRASEKVITN